MSKDSLNDNQKLALILDLFNAGDISNAIKIVESYRPKGKWVNHRCNVCNYLPYSEGEMYFNYCPYCGSRMEKE